MTYVKLYYNNSGYIMCSRYLEIVIILDIVIFGDEQRKNKKTNET